MATLAIFEPSSPAPGEATLRRLRATRTELCGIPDTAPPGHPRCR